MALRVQATDVSVVQELNTLRINPIIVQENIHCDRFTIV